MKSGLLHTIYIVCICLVVSCTTNTHLVDTQAVYHKTSQTSPSNSSIEEMIEPYKVKMEEKMNVVIGTLAHDLEKEKPESTLGNFVAEAVFDICQSKFDGTIDFAVVNYGGLRIPSMKEGNITRGHIFELMPFDNMLVVMDLDGETTLELFHQMAGYGGWPISHQATYSIVDGTAENIMINNQGFDQNKRYKVAISDYIANGGDKCFFLEDQPRENLGILFRDALIEYIELKKDKPIEVKTDGRVVE